MKEIKLSEPRETTVEEQLRAAIYQMSPGDSTKITCGDRTVWLVDAWFFERCTAAAERAVELNTRMSTLCVCGQNQQTAPLPGWPSSAGNVFGAHNDAAGDPCPGLPLPFPPTVQEEAGWTCRKCGSSRWVAASLTGPVGYGGVAIKQCVPCGEYSGDKVPPTAQEAGR